MNRWTYRNEESFKKFQVVAASKRVVDAGGRILDVLPRALIVHISNKNVKNLTKKQLKVRKLQDFKLNEITTSIIHIEDLAQTIVSYYSCPVVALCEYC